MKRTAILFTFLLAVPLAAVIGATAVPQPSFIIYGQAVDEFGWPYVTNASITVWINDRSFKTYDITGMIAPNVNFSIHVPLESSSSTQPNPRVAHTDDNLRITLSAFGETKSLMSITPLSKVGQPGEIDRVNLAAGTDTDGDGLPEDFAKWIVDRANNPLIRTTADVRPEDDADGDGASNMQEYLAGTDPANPLDRFCIEEWELLANGRLRLTFLTVPGKTYQLFVAPIGASATFPWDTCPFALSDTGDMQAVPILGTGHYQSLFVDTAQPARVYQLRTQ